MERRCGAKGSRREGGGEVRGWKNVEGRGRWEEGEIMGRRGVRERLGGRKSGRQRGKES